MLPDYVDAFAIAIATFKVDETFLVAFVLLRCDHLHDFLFFLLFLVDFRMGIQGQRLRLLRDCDIGHFGGFRVCDLGAPARAVPENSRFLLSSLISHPLNVLYAVHVLVVTCHFRVCHK